MQYVIFDYILNFKILKNETAKHWNDLKKF